MRTIPFPAEKAPRTLRKVAAPRQMSAEARKLWAELRDEYAITDPGGLLLLCRACEALDRLRRAQKIIRSRGEVISDKKGSIKTNPAVAVEKEAHKQLLDAIKALNLDVEPVKPIGRPGA